MQKSKMMYADGQRKKRELMEEAKRMSACDRKEKAQDGPAKASVANKLNFGANLVKFQPPANQGG